MSSVNLYFKPPPSDSRCTTPSDPQNCFIPVRTNDEMLDRVRRAARKPGATGVYGANYDPARLGHGASCPGPASKVGFECPNLEDGHARERLDAVSSTIPIFVSSESGHICGIFENQDSTGCYTPVFNPVQETALAKAGQLDEDLTLYAEGFYDEKFLKDDPVGTASHVLEAANIYAQHGFTLNQEGAAGLFEVGLYVAAMKADPKFPLSSAMMMYNSSLDFSKATDDAKKAQALIDAVPQIKSDHRMFIGGLKFADGSPQGFTADLSQPYYKLFPPFTWPVFPKPYTGLPDFGMSELTRRAHRNGGASGRTQDHPDLRDDAARHLSVESPCLRAANLAGLKTRATQCWSRTLDYAGLGRARFRQVRGSRLPSRNPPSTTCSAPVM